MSFSLYCFVASKSYTSFTIFSFGKVSVLAKEKKKQKNDAPIPTRHVLGGVYTSLGRGTRKKRKKDALSL